MAFNTYRKNVKAVYFTIPIMMMVMVCVIPANVAQQGCGRDYFVGFHGISNSAICQYFLWMSAISPFIISSCCGLAVFALFIYFMLKLNFMSISFVSKFALLAHTRFTPGFDTKTASFLSLKFRNWFGSVAISAFFRYNRVIHCLFLEKRYWLGLVVGSIPTSSLSIVWPFMVSVKKTYQGFA